MGGLLLSLLLGILSASRSPSRSASLLALGRQSKLPAIRVMSVIYIEFIRGVPLISLLFMGQVMLQLFLPDGFPLVDRVLRALVAITLFSAAYTAENVRGGLQSITRGQYEAAQALGLSAYRSTMHIILPQALRAVIPCTRRPVHQPLQRHDPGGPCRAVRPARHRQNDSPPTRTGSAPSRRSFSWSLYFSGSSVTAMSYASRRLEQRLGVGER